MCLFFRVGLGLEVGGERELRSEEARKGVEVGVEDMVDVLVRFQDRVACVF